MKSLKGILICLSFAACSISVPNIELCGRIPSNGAQCAWTIEGKDKRISEETWEAWEGSSEGMVCMNAEGFGEIKKTLLKVCKKFPDECKSPTHVESHIDRLQKKLGIKE